ncbi:MAG: tetratricopeptide repeat protein [Lachnospiraceae bacterium]|nr:tetratricopeptide repeat protein [Lachnospiraceae bacterium]
MFCYHCGCNLTEHDFCTNCGADVSTYKIVVSASNIFYNEGLEKAKVRDLSGAIASLRQCLKLNKNHVDARNLLGLVYFEIGESILALNEWVISKNLRSKKNLAGEYLKLIQNNPGKLESLNGTIKKYNQALTYCYQDSTDMAVIQLKKVLSMNPKYVKAHLLLALLYIYYEDWAKAKKEIERVLRVDSNNTQALRYLQEIVKVAGDSDNGGKGNKNNKGNNKAKAVTANTNIISDESYQYQSGNETIIQPLNYSEKKSFQSIWNLVIGIIVGFAVAWFLVLPARIQTEKATINDELRLVSEQLDVKTATINELESKVKNLEEETADLQGQLQGFVGNGGTLEDVNNLLQAARVYIENPADTVKIGSYIEKINPESITEESSESFTSLYGLLLGEVGTDIGKKYYEEGMDKYQNGNYEAAIEDLKKAIVYDARNQDAYYNLGNAYRKLEKDGEAIEVYQKIIELFPSTSMANRAQSFINELTQE